MSLLDQDLEQLQAGSGYKFSATKIDTLEASQYTLATIVMDASGSVEPFAQLLEQALKIIFKACDKSPRRENLMLRLTQFSSRLTELHGFKLLGSIQEQDYNGILQLGGNTALFDSVDEAIQATSTYAKQLYALDYQDNNAIIVVVTDGENNTGSIMDASQIKKSLMAARREEKLGSILLILVGVTNDDVNLNTYLQTVKDDGGFDQYVSIGKATPGKIAKLAEFVSQSISSTSSALASGTQSTPLSTAQFKF